MPEDYLYDQDTTAAAADVVETDPEAAPIPTSFGTVTGRLSEIADAVADETLPLDEALSLLEEAVGLGMQASDLLEADMETRNAEEADEEAAEEAALDAGGQDIEGVQSFDGGQGLQWSEEARGPEDEGTTANS